MSERCLPNLNIEACGLALSPRSFCRSRKCISLVDYRIWSFNGEIKYVRVCYAGDKDGADVMAYDWN